MPNIWKPLKISDYLHWVETITIEASDKLTEWETNFVTDIGMQLGNGFNLSEKQAEVLERIYTQKTS